MTKFDLEERTSKFSENIILFIKKIPPDRKLDPILNQLLGSATSVGANYCEADDAHSKKDFCHKIAICKKESRETKYWLRLVASAFPEYKEEAKLFWQEAQELNLIFASIYNKKIS